MKKLLLLTASFVFTAISAFAAEAKIALTISQKSPIPIVIPAKVAEADRYAARELRDYIGKITGAKVRILYMNLGESLHKASRYGSKIKLTALAAWDIVLINKRNKPFDVGVGVISREVKEDSLTGENTLFVGFKTG